MWFMLRNTCFIAYTAQDYTCDQNLDLINTLDICLFVVVCFMKCYFPITPEKKCNWNSYYLKQELNAYNESNSMPLSM